MRRLCWLAVLACACKAQLADSPDALNQGQDSGGSDLQDDAAPPPDGPVMLGPWNTPTPIPGASTAGISEDDLTLNEAQTELYFAIPDTTITGNPKDLYVMTRASKADPWGAKQKLTILDTSVAEESPRLSPDELTLYFGRAGQIFSSTRAAPGQPWGTPTAVGAVNTTAYEKWLAVCNGGYFLVSRDSGASQDLYEGTLGNGPGTLVSSLSDPAVSEISTFLSHDCKTAYFSRAGVILGSMRVSTADPWPAPTPIGPPIDDTGEEEDGWLSDDLHTFVYVTNKGGSKDLYITTR